MKCEIKHEVPRRSSGRRYRVGFFSVFLGMMNSPREGKRLERSKSKKKTSLHTRHFQDEGIWRASSAAEMSERKTEKDL